MYSLLSGGPDMELLGVDIIRYSLMTLEHMKHNSLPFF